MAYVPVPKDLTKVKTKVMFNLTRRQLVCFTAGALVGVPLFFLLREPAGNSMAAMCMMLVMMPFFLLAMYEKHGQPLEKIVGNILKVAVIRPKQRPYQTNNFYAVLKRQEMEIRGDLLTDKENAGAALLDACKEVKTSDPVQIGSYRGYAMSVEFSAWKQEYTLLLKGQMTHRATLGTDPRGNLTRIDNALAQMPQRLEAAKAQLDNLYQQQAAAKEEVGKPFLYEKELRSKNARLVELDTLLNIDGKGQAHTESVVAKSTRPSVLDNLKRPVQPRSTDKKPKQHEEVR